MSVDPEALKTRYRRVCERIEAACRRAGRDPASVQLVAVSKRHPPEAIRVVHGLGQRLFGENYAQELEQKAEALADLPGLGWHFIGGFQKNKAAVMARTGATVETVAKTSHADALDRRAASGTAVPVLIQVNVAGESQKSGCAPAEVPALVSHLADLRGVRLRGLMTIPPADDPEAARRCYRSLGELARAHDLDELSMGMSSDLEIAVEEGATLVRVGTAIFGPRPTP